MIKVELSAHGILFNISAIIYMLWWGIGVAACTRIGLTNLHEKYLYLHFLMLILRAFTWGESTKRDTKSYRRRPPCIHHPILYHTGSVNWVYGSYYFVLYASRGCAHRGTSLKVAKYEL